ncbi:MAG: hypothetical protein RIG26_06130 [Thalassospira sp.]|uniref:hypothetical protein n=1 Tax=Thalassospira sp. TaxID=1912094 RepID=UPI0032ED8EAC
MICKRDTTNALARELLDTYDLCLVGTARSPDELSPGMCIVETPPSPKSRTFCCPWIDIFKDELSAEASKVQYVVAEITHAGEVSAAVLGHLSQIPGVTPEGAAEIGAELAKAQNSTLSLGLEQANRTYIPPHKIEKAVRGGVLQDYAIELFSEGAKIYIVHETVTAIEATIKGSKDSNALVALLANAELVGKAKLKASLREQEANSISIKRADAPMVIGFKAFELIKKNNSAARSMALRKPLKVRGVLDDGEGEPENEFLLEEDIFSYPELRC